MRQLSSLPNRARQWWALSLGLLFAGGFLLHQFLHSYWHEQIVELPDTLSLDIAKGTSTNALVHQLTEEGVLHSQWLGKVGLRIFFPGFVLKSGEYELHGNLTRAAIFARLNDGISTQYRVTFVEGKSLAQLASDLQGVEKLLLPEKRILGISDWSGLLSPEAKALMGDAIHPEGWFYPDTYYFSRDESWESIVRRAHARMLEVLMEEWDQRSGPLPYDNPYQALIMASLIERETGVVDEREEIAGVFVRRLQKGMRLQTDPSVIYGLGDAYDGNLTRTHLRTDTPYNTYTRGGLPPTPIAAPGRGAIRAALNPAAGKSLYFVAMGDGRHKFSETLEEHQEAVKRFQLQRRSDYRSSPAAPAGSGSGNSSGSPGSGAASKKS